MGTADRIRSMFTTRNERNESTSDRFRMAARRTARRLLEERDLPILDVAGREGYLFDPRVSSISHGVTVLDIEHAPLKTGMREWEGLGSFVQGDLTMLPFPDGIFRASICIGTFYNLPSSSIVIDGLREMGRVTAPGGRILCEFRNASNPLMRFAAAHARKYDPSIGNLPLETYTYDTAAVLFKRAGLVIRRTIPIMPAWKPLALMFIVEAHPLPRARGAGHA